GDEGEASLRFDWLAGELVTGNGDAAACRRDDPGERAERRRLPRTIRSDKAEHLARANGKREILDRDEVAVQLGEGVDDDHGACRVACDAWRATPDAPRAALNAPEPRSGPR